jgi:hypothetical protein
MRKSTLQDHWWFWACALLKVPKWTETTEWNGEKLYVVMRASEPFGRGDLVVMAPLRSRYRLVGCRYAPFAHMSLKGR